MAATETLKNLNGFQKNKNKIKKKKKKSIDAFRIIPASTRQMLPISVYYVIVHGRVVDAFVCGTVTHYKRKPISSKPSLPK